MHKGHEDFLKKHCVLCEKHCDLCGKKKLHITFMLCSQSVRIFFNHEGHEGCTKDTKMF